MSDSPTKSPAPKLPLTKSLPARTMRRFAVVGGGAWGTALAQMVFRAGGEALLVVRNPLLAEAISKSHQNPDYLPGIVLDNRLVATSEIERVINAEAILIVTPAQALRETLSRLLPHWPEDVHGGRVPCVLCCKGIELASGLLMSEVAREILPAETALACLSGPTFAHEVARGLPTAITLTCGEATIGAALVKGLGSKSFRPYLGHDVIGAEIGGAVKNVIAIAAGIVEGRAMGVNARAALITRGLAEMTRLGVAKGGHAETFAGLSGIGDLMLTANAMESRNFSLGVQLGQGIALADILAGRRGVTEGVSTARAVVALAKSLAVDMPLCQAVNDILHHRADVAMVINGLLTRPFRGEMETSPLH